MHPQHCHLMLVLLACNGTLLSASEKNSRGHCRYIYKNSFRHCHNRVPNSNFANRVYEAPSNGSHASCTRGKVGVCAKIFNITQVHDQILTAHTLDKLSAMLEQCCGKCGMFMLGNLETKLPHLDFNDIEKTDILFPVLGRFSLTELYGMYYIPIFEVPSAYLLMLEKTDKEMAKLIIDGCLGMWPLLVICVMWAVIAGFFVWILETWWNEEEFPRPFLKGLFEGFWWSFVSMTTVGYGDKAPKRLLGRLFAVIWILIGITITSMYIGELAGTIYGLQAPVDTPPLNGRLVGGLKHQLQDATIVAQHGAILHDIEAEDEVLGVMELLKQLKAGVIEGIVINKMIYQTYLHNVHDNPKYAKHAKIVKDIHVVRAELDYRGERVVTGMLIKEKEDYQFFKRYFENNWLQIQACNSFELNSKDEIIEYNEPSHFKGLFYPFFNGTVMTLASLLIFGVIYEVFRKRFVKKCNIRKNVELCGQNNNEEVNIPH